MTTRPLPCDSPAVRKRSTRQLYRAAPLAQPAALGGPTYWPGAGEPWPGSAVVVVSSGLLGSVGDGPDGAVVEVLPGEVEGGVAFGSEVAGSEVAGSGVAGSEVGGAEVGVAPDWPGVARSIGMSIQAWASTLVAAWSAMAPGPRSGLPTRHDRVRDGGRRVQGDRGPRAWTRPNPARSDHQIELTLTTSPV